MAGNSSVLMLRMNGSNGSTTFIDEMGKTVTNNNSVTQSNTIVNPYSGSTSAYFNNNYLSLANSTDFDFGTGDFTIECWFNIANDSPANFNGNRFACLIGTKNSGTSYDYGWELNIKGDTSTTGTGFSFAAYNSSGTGIISINTVNTISKNMWNHIAITRKDGTMYLFFNGNNIYSGSHSADIQISTLTTTVGRLLLTNYSHFFNGYMSDLHIIKGYAKYTANFSVPTNYVPKYIQYSSQKVVSMLHFDGVHGTSDILDESGRSWTNNNVKLRSTQYKFGNSSAYFNGSSSYLSTSAGQDFNFGTDDFTIETLLYINGNSPATQDGNYYQANIFSVANTTGQGSPANMFELLLITSGLGANTGTGGAQFAMWNSAGTIASATTGSISQGAWHHVAVTRSGTSLNIFLNGTKTTTTIASTFSVDASAHIPLIGYRNYTGYNRYFNGYIDGFQVIKGYAKYTQDFTIPSSPIPRMVLGMHMDSTKTGGTTFVEETGKTITNTNVIGVATNKKFGLTSAYFDGSAYLTVPNSTDLNLAGEDWTISSWIYLTEYANNTNGYASTIISKDISSNRQYCFYTSGTATEYNAIGMWLYSGSTGTSIDFDVPAKISLKRWYHVEYVRSGNTIYGFLDGQLLGTRSYSSVLNTSTAAVTIGAWNHAAGYEYRFRGMIDELVVIKGQALHTSSFTPSTKQFEKNCVAGLRFEGSNGNTTFTDISGKTWTASGGAQISTAQSKIGSSSGYFNGTNSYISTPASSDFAMGTGAWTMECLAYPTSYNGGVYLIHIAGGVSDRTNIGIDAAGTVTVYSSRTGYVDKYHSTTNTVSLNTWTHLAATYDGVTLRIFINGVLSYLNNVSFGTWTANQAVYVGATGPLFNANYFAGYIDSVRIIKGEALYLEDFTPPTQDFPNNKSLGMHFDETSAATTFNDLTGKAITVGGNAKLTNNLSKFGGISAYFDGASYLTTPSNTDFAFGTGDFTIDGWFNITGNSAVNSNGYRYGNIISNYFNGSSTVVGFGILIAGSGNSTGTSLDFQWWTGSTWAGMGATYVFNKNQWYHFAVVRKNGSVFILINGVLISSGACSQNFTSNTILQIGYQTLSSPNNQYFNGYIDDLRILKGVALYDSDFNIPSSAFKDREEFKFAMYNNTTATNMPSAQQSAAPIALYKLSDYQATSTTTDGTYIADSSGNGNHAKAYGDLSLATINGVTGLYFGGNSSYVESYAISNLQDLSNGYTLEFLVQPNSITSGYANLLGLCQSYANNTVNDSIYISKPNNTSTLDAIDDIGTQYYNGVTSTTLLTADKSYKSLDGWKHVVVVHSPLGLRKVYVNNQLVGSDYIALPDIAVNRNRIMLGRVSGSTNAFVGHLANVAVYDKALTTAQINNNYKAFIGEQVIHLATVIDSILLTELYPSGYTLLAEALESVTLEEINEAKQYAWATGDDALLTAVESVYIFKAVTVILETIKDAINASDVSEGISVQFSTGSDTLQFLVSPADTNYGWVVTAIDQLYFNSLVNEKVIFEGLTSDQLLLATQFLITAPAFAEDSIISTDEGKVFLLVIKTIVENLTISDSVAPSRSVLSTISDNLNITDQLDSNAFLQALVTSKLIFTTKSKQGGTVYTGYCVNKNIGATSLYENFKFNSYAKSNGKYYGASTDGIYELDMSDTDNGESINAMFTTGLIDCGNSLKKRITDSFLAVRTDGQVFLRVMADGKEFTYKLSRDNDGMFEGSRVKIGKGLEAVNWQFELFNSEGSDFDIDSMKIYPLMLSRHGGGGSR